MSDYWQKQSDTPLFEDLLWSRPQNRRQAGKLLILGGNLHGFSAPANAYTSATQAGIGTARVLMPDAIQKTVKLLLEHAEFCPSTPSGSFAARAYSELTDQAAWADGVLLAGDFGRNSETAVLLEKFANNYKGQLCLTKDAVDYFQDVPMTIFTRPETALVCSLAQLQRLIQKSDFIKPVTFSMGLVQLVELLQELTSQYPVHIITKHLDSVIVATGGHVSTTKVDNDQEIWRIQVASYSSVCWIQNSTKPFEALTTAVFENYHHSSTEN